MVLHDSTRLRKIIFTGFHFTSPQVQVPLNTEYKANSIIDPFVWIINKQLGILIWRLLFYFLDHNGPREKSDPTFGHQPMDFRGLPRIFHGIPRIFHGHPYIFHGMPQISHGFPRIPYGYSTDIPWDATNIPRDHTDIPRECSAITRITRNLFYKKMTNAKPLSIYFYFSGFT